VPAPAAVAVSPPGPKRPPETFWYRPSQPEDADAIRPWNSSILGAFDPWTKEKITLLAQKQTLRLEGGRTRGTNRFTDSAGNESRYWYEPVRLTQDQFGPRLEWGNWSVSWAQGRATFTETTTGRSTSARFNEITIARGFGATVLYDFGIPDVRIGVSWPEIYLRGGWSDEVTNVSSTIAKMSFTEGAIGVSFVGLRLTVGDLLFAEARIGHWGFHAIGRAVTYRGTDPSAGNQEDTVVQEGRTLDWLPTFRVGLAL
jgi:hypothetical protein